MNKEEYQILTASWIMASNDDNNLMTFESIGKRLGIGNIGKIKKLILSHGELFRRGTQKSILEEWKEEMHMGKSIPSWIKDLPLSDQRIKINNLSTDDVFRSQFRIKKGDNKSSLDVMDWGLQYLERIYTNESSHTKTIIQIITLLIVIASLVLEILKAIKIIV